MINLACPKCGIRAEAEFFPNSKEAHVWVDSKLLWDFYCVPLPVHCVACENEPPEMLIARKCLTCAGTGRWQTKTSSAVCECPDCIGAGKTLEEQANEHEG